MKDGKSPLVADNWLSNLGSSQVLFTRLPLSIYGFYDDDSFFFPASMPGDPSITYLPLRRWDMIFVGQVMDNPATPEDESLISKIITGLFKHIIEGGYIRRSLWI
ncbi:MAG: hypothetical protein ACUVQ2_04865 [Dissulfurimicrobium sp.]|uniref:hypothetical protein n=1 Tax=Dissulfurimicrobium sp. TaxID=2022436 RepID=UPI00404BA0EE